MKLVLLSMAFMAIVPKEIAPAVLGWLAFAAAWIAVGAMTYSMLKELAKAEHELADKTPHFAVLMVGRG